MCSGVGNIGAASGSLSPHWNLARDAPTPCFRTDRGLLALGTVGALHRERRNNVPMTSSWPILLGVCALIVAAFWYDASNASANAPGAPAQAAEVR